ncbi:MAG: LytR C-terminal domain-containing protein [Thermoleophilaceae bacterium]|nr:LytR C-terminal domain-containing protein [Thermoleophilaceae bacterium]
MQDIKNIVTDIGAIAGFASVIGLAVLAMLYFSQARDVRRLREWAGRAPERDAEVQQLASQIASQAIADVYAAMPAAEVAEEVAEVEAIPPPVEGQLEMTEVLTPGDEAQAAPDELVVASDTAGESTEWSPYSDPSVVGAAAAAAGAGVAGQADHDADAQAGDETPAVAPDQPLIGQHTQEFNALEAAQLQEDAPVAGTETRPSRLAPSTPAAARAAGVLPPLPSGFTGPTPALPDTSDYQAAAAESVGTGTYSFRELEAADESRRRRESRSGGRAPFIVAGLLVVVFGSLLVYTQVAGDDSKAPKTAEKPPAQTAPSGSNPRINKPAVQVVVLNGTRITGLAAVIGDQVDQVGFTLKSVGNRNNGVDYIQSVVYYTPGNKLEAEEVAKQLSIETVKPADRDVAVAGANAPVIVLVGSDREQ